ncbi:MAG: hypothetical protein IPK60_25475 [Sandaracinaceae bacterium]|nr:hypothetical protein [Sandaracinaceae bacterium]
MLKKTTILVLSALFASCGCPPIVDEPAPPSNEVVAECTSTVNGARVQAVNVREYTHEDSIEHGADCFGPGWVLTNTHYTITFIQGGDTFAHYTSATSEVLVPSDVGEYDATTDSIQIDSSLVRVHDGNVIGPIQTASPARTRWIHVYERGGLAGPRLQVSIFDAPSWTWLGAGEEGMSFSSDAPADCEAKAAGSVVEWSDESNFTIRFHLERYADNSVCATDPATLAMERSMSFRIDGSEVVRTN